MYYKKDDEIESLNTDNDENKYNDRYQLLMLDVQPGIICLVL